MSVLIVNAGLAGSAGNSQVVVSYCERWLRGRSVDVRTLTLRGAALEEVRASLAAARSLVLVSGTYWGGCSSVLQEVLERLTPTEASELWLGKPAAVLVTAHQVGAQEVLFRLQGVLVSLGCLLPPLSGVAISRVAEQLLRAAPGSSSDVWNLRDVDIALHNLLACHIPEAAWRVWDVDRHDYDARWLELPASD